MRGVVSVGVGKRLEQGKLLVDLFGRRRLALGIIARLPAPEKPPTRENQGS